MSVETSIDGPSPVNPPEDQRPIGTPAPIEAPKRSPSLKSNFWWMLFGNAIYAASQWAVLGLFARLESSATLGELVLALSVTAPVMAFFLLQMRVVQATDTRREFLFGHFLALRLLALAAAIATIALINVHCGYRPQSRWMIAAVALMSTADALSDVAYGLLQQHEQMQKISQSLILRAALGLIAIGMTLHLTHNPVLAFVAGALIRFSIVCGFDWQNIRVVLANDIHARSPRWDFHKLYSLARLALPLGTVMMLIVLNNNIPRYFVERYLDHSALGIFGAISYLSVTGMTIVGALGESITPRMARAYDQVDKSEFLRLYSGLIKTGIGLGAVGVALSISAGPLILRLLYGAEYASHSRLLVWIAVTAGVGYIASFSGYAITSARCFRSQLPLFAIVAITNGFACHWFVPRMGLDGAALSGLLAVTVQLLGTLSILWYGLTVSSPAGRSRLRPSIDNLSETA